MLLELIAALFGLLLYTPVENMPEVQHAFFGLGGIISGAIGLGKSLFGDNPAATLGSAIGGGMDYKFKNKQLEQEEKARQQRLAEDRRQFDASFGLQQAAENRTSDMYNRRLADQKFTNPNRHALMQQTMANVTNRAPSADATQVGLSGDFGLRREEGAAPQGAAMSDRDRMKKKRMAMVNNDPRTDARY